ncbi:MAG TPA: SIMPL domain-containing protein [Candidatus Polarisedimenticolia bacterium]|nr:SIMPL domain-containing protein [Candidatus Polarisedimenticolia bacterium]
MNESRSGLLRPAILAAGIALAGGLIGHGFVRAHASDRYVTVKGISERKVQADIAFWPIMLSAADNDLHAAQARVDAQMEQVKAFLVKQELDPSGFEVQSPSVSDAWTNQYQDRTKVATRFVVNQTLMVYSEKPQAVATASRKVGELVSAGMVLNSGQGPIFMFTRLNDIKPEMIAEATKRAREGAEQFARDSGGRLDGIRQASQGVFEIQPRDPIPGASEETQMNKTVRVVTTVQYALAG